MNDLITQNIKENILKITLNNPLSQNTLSLDIINKLTPQDYYDMDESIDYNYHRALENSNFFKRIEEWIDELIKINNL